MRIRIVGECQSAKAVRGMLNNDGNVVVSDDGYVYTVSIFNTDHDLPTVDGVDSEAERKFINRIADVASTDILLLRKGGVQADNQIAIGVPAGIEALVERGIAQAVIQMAMGENKPIQAKPYEAPQSVWVEHLSLAQDLAELKLSVEAIRAERGGIWAKVCSWFA